MQRVFVFIVAIFAAVSCKESLPEHFDDITGVYFDNRSSAGALVDSTAVTFVYESSDRLNVPVKISLIGRVSDKDRSVSVRVGSDDAKEGVDFILPQNTVIAVGEDEVEYVVTLVRSEELKKRHKSLLLKLYPDNEFALPLPGEKNAAGEFVSAIEFKIVFSDMFTAAPAAWYSDLLGIFTQQKFELACRVLEINPSDFNNPQIMTLSKSLFVSQEMKRYIADQVERKNAGLEYDKDAFDNETGEPLVF